MASWSSPTAPAALIHPGARQHEGRGEQPEQGAFKSPPSPVHPSLLLPGVGVPEPPGKGENGAGCPCWLLVVPLSPPGSCCCQNFGLCPRGRASH